MIGSGGMLALTPWDRVCWDAPFEPSVMVSGGILPLDPQWGVPWPGSQCHSLHVPFSSMRPHNIFVLSVLFPSPPVELQVSPHLKMHLFTCYSDPSLGRRWILIPSIQPSGVPLLNFLKQSMTPQMLKGIVFRDGCTKIYPNQTSPWRGWKVFFLPMNWCCIMALTSGVQADIWLIRP